MAKGVRLGLWLGCLVGFLSVAWGETYEVNVTRDASNLYKVTNKELLIVTRYCYEYVYYADALLLTHRNEIVFVDDASKCDVESVYAKANVTGGTYQVNVSHKDDDFYELDGKGLLLKTSLCLNLALGDEAILKITPYGTGTIYFLDDEERCDVEGVYTPARL